MVVEANVFADGHDQVAMSDLVLARRREDVQSSPMKPLGNDRWRGEFSVLDVGRYQYTVEGWIDRFKTWRSDLIKRIAAGQDVHVEMLIGAQLIEEVAARAGGEDAELLRRWIPRLREAKEKDLQESNGS